MSFFKKGDDKLPIDAIEDLKQKIFSACMPPEVREIAENELLTMSRISPLMAEYSIGLTYIEYLVSLPWNKRTEDNLDLRRADERAKDPEALVAGLESWRALLSEVAR